MARRLKRTGLGMLTLLLAVAIGLAAWEPLTATRAAPPPAHRYDTVIARDTWGVPHIYGKTDADVAYGIAYAQSEDDFPTMQQVLAMTRGRLGALDGQDGARTDYVVHLLGARATVERDYMKQPADVRALLDGYASGMNAYAARHPGEVKLARLFPVNGRDVATGFVVRSPFFFGLDQVLGALAGDAPLPKENAGPLPDAPDFTRWGRIRARTARTASSSRRSGRATGIPGWSPTRISPGRAASPGTSWWCIRDRAGTSPARTFRARRIRCSGTTRFLAGPIRSTAPI